MGVKMIGLEKLQKALKDNVNLDDVKKVVKQNGAELQKKAQRNVPVDTGTLKRSVEPPEISDGGMTATVEPTAEYAPYVEFGTRYMEAQPFMKPAYNEQKEQFKRDMQKLVR